MTEIGSIKPYSVRWQVVLALLTALRTLRGAHTKQEVISFIDSERYFDLKLEDKRSYPSSNTKEPRWQTLVAWARKDCVEHMLMTNDADDSWEATGKGLNFVAIAKQAFQESELVISRCFLLTTPFKRHFVPDFVTSPTDAPRPPHMYQDLLPPWLASPRGNQLSRSLDQYYSSPEGSEAAKRLRKLLDEM